MWDHITRLLADPALIRAEISKRLEQARTSDPATQQRQRLEPAFAQATTAITAMIEAFQEQLITIDELRARIPGLRARQTSLRSQLDALDAQLADRDAYLKLADDLEGFLAQLRDKTGTASIPERQRVLRLLVKDVLIGPEKITIRHRIPARGDGTATRQHDTQTDTEGDQQASCPLRWGRGVTRPGQPVSALRHGFVAGTRVPVRGVRADDAVLHCSTEYQARKVRDALAERLESLGLRLHPGKTKIVYCRDDNRRGSHEHTSFTFLGYEFRSRSAENRNGQLFTTFSPAISPDALKAKSQQVRGWRIHKRVGSDLEDLAEWINPVVRGWMNYYGRFSRSRLYRLLQHINTYIVRWARNKYRRLGSFKKAKRWWTGLVDREPGLFAHWAWISTF